MTVAVASALTLNEAMDLVDAYGPDEDLWPRAHKDALNDMLSSDDDFRNYVEDVRWLDNLLNNWDESDDGVDVGNTDDDDWGGDEEEDEDQDEDTDDGASMPVDPGGMDDGRRAAPDEDDDSVIELNPERLKDMDEMFQDALQKAFTNADPTEFRVFTRDYDQIVDINGVTDQTSIEGIDKAVAKSTGPLQKDLRRLIAARSQVKRVPGMRRGRLHGPNLHRILSGDDRVFTRREEAQSLDTAISLVIDCSGSMGGEAISLAAQTAYALGSVLSRLNIQFECLGFTDNYHDPRIRTKEYQQEVAAADAVAKITRHIPLVMPKFKTFEERWTQPVQRRFGHIYNSGGYNCGISMGSTPEGCGMEFAARRLIARKEKRKIMIVMTDGEPGGHIYHGRTPGDYFAYRRQSGEMVKAIEAAGVDLIGVGIQHAGPTGYYTNSMVINAVEEMPQQLMALLKKFIVG